MKALKALGLLLLGLLAVATLAAIAGAVAMNISWTRHHAANISPAFLMGQFGVLGVVLCLSIAGIVALLRSINKKEMTPPPLPQMNDKD